MKQHIYKPPLTNESSVQTSDIRMKGRDNSIGFDFIPCIIH